LNLGSKRNSSQLGEKPLIPHGFKNATQDPQAIKRLFAMQGLNPKTPKSKNPTLTNPQNIASLSIASLEASESYL
jgi:hypothetical protein